MWGLANIMWIVTIVIKLAGPNTAEFSQFEHSQFEFADNSNFYHDPLNILSKTVQKHYL